MISCAHEHIMRTNNLDGNMPYTIAFVNQKGGSGKSKTAGGLAGELAAMGRRVLVIDADPQGTITAWMLGSRNRNGLLGLAEVLGYGITDDSDREPPSLEETALRSESFELHVVAADFANLSNVEKTMTSDASRTADLLAAVEQVGNKYDYIIIDTPGSLGQLTMAAVLASDGLIIPIDSDTEAVQGFGRLLKALQRMRQLHATFEILGVVATRFKANTGYSAHVLGEVKANTTYPIYATIRESIRVAETTNANLPIGKYAPNEPAHGDFRKLAEIVDTHVQSKNMAHAR